MATVGRSRSAAAASRAQTPEPIRALANEVPRILAQMQNLVARERMTLFEQVRGSGIPDNAFDPRSVRHYPRGSLTFSDGSLRRVDFEWTSGGLVTSVAMDFTPPQDPDRIPRPLKYVARTRQASSSRPLSQTTFEYGDYRHFGVRTETATAPSGR